ERVPREREPRDDPRVAGDGGGLVALALVDARQPVGALAALERAAVAGERLETRSRLVPLAEEVVRHPEEPQRVVDPLRARIAPERGLERRDRRAVMAAVELEPAREELRLLRIGGARVARDDLLVPGDRFVVAVGTRQRPRAMKHRFGRGAAHLRVAPEQEARRVAVAPAHLEQRDAERVVALAGDVV